ncbi:hypothetical protein [Microcoleus sp. FACHB-672]|uniref:hypothetical protein n=1 Tax=Microcoleus sp. FACHB-672 TaxID=2692825 RepID=UPI00168989D6|nr:hypothetical protein [Microcoleus sp. FACHB-672]MBD2042960.1 hypothetical protein [Microcoleus sp. FACHB-672]
MDKQTRLNQFVRDLCAFIERYYSVGVQSVKVVEMEGWVKGIIEEPTGDALEIQSDREEITIVYGESHWHIDYNEQYQDIYQAAIQSVFEVLDGKFLTFSAWAGERALGGGSLSSETEDAVAEALNRFKRYEGFTELVIKVWGCERIYERAKPEDA